MKSYQRLNLEDGKTIVDKALLNHFEDSLESLCEVAKEVDGWDEGVNVTDISSLETHNGFCLSTGTWGNINDSYQYVLIPVFGNQITLNMVGCESKEIYYAGLRSYSEPVNKAALDFSEDDAWSGRRTLPKGSTINTTVPEDVKYLLVSVLSNNIPSYPTSFSLTASIGGGKVNNLMDRVSALEKIGVKYIALGDSITEGIYSDDTGSYRAHENSYVSVLARLKGYDVTNKGVGGSGWLKRGTTLSPKLNAREQIDAKNEDGSYTIDFTQYDLCTLCWGVNDWKGNENLGSFEDGLNPEVESVYANIRYCIETIMQRNPNLKLIVISPVNSRRGVSSNPQTAEHNWGIGYEFNGKTLADFYNAIKEVCEYYGIEFVDMLYTSVINRLNIETLLPDEVHPSLEAHILMGKELAGKIKYGC